MAKLDVARIKEVVRPIAIQYGVKRVFLFGSYASGAATIESDVDLLIEKGKDLTLLDLSGLRLDFQEGLEKSVDLVTTSGIDEIFKEEIAGTEVLLYEEERHGHSQKNNTLL